MHKSNRVESENLLECHNERVYGSYHFFSRLCFIFFSRALKFQEEIHLEQFRLDRHFCKNLAGFLMPIKEYCHAVNHLINLNIVMLFGQRARLSHSLATDFLAMFQIRI